ncbi:MAG: helix-turn-helix domain-containing protein [Defluviitaleaceae bacterium]|nr:helix-turn-helix domain-containing protein [Defluviitaleaceae bacterium]
MYADVFPSRLKKAREYNGLTQLDVSKAIKVNRSTYTNYEAGRSEPNMEILALLSRLFDVSADWLIGLTSDSGLNSMTQVIQEREREKILKKLEKEAELNRRVWG